MARTSANTVTMKDVPASRTKDQEAQEARKKDETMEKSKNIDAGTDEVSESNDSSARADGGLGAKPGQYDRFLEYFLSYS